MTKDNQKITVKNLAEILRLDPPSVSLALRDSAKISVATCRRVKELAEKYNYSPNLAARQLRCSSPQLAGLALPEVMDALDNSMTANRTSWTNAGFPDHGERSPGQRPQVGRLFVIFVALFCSVAHAANWYVATNGTGGGTSWADATNDIQGAIIKSSVGETVWVSNGVYETGGLTGYPAGTVLTNRVVITKAITVRSANGPSVTTIKGAWDQATTNGLAAVRCVNMAANSMLIGFTLTKGATLLLNTPVVGTNENHNGGGVYCQSITTPIISNCVLTGNSASRFGGGTFYGTLYNCTLISNIVWRSPDVDNFGGGAWEADLFNCLLIGNRANDGGGARNGKLYNCTVVGNSAAQGGGVRACKLLYNCILYFNSPDNWNSITAFTNSCTTPEAGGWAGGNITNDPIFIAKGSGYGTSHVPGNYRMRGGSPCINAGANLSWMTNAFDMDDRVRIRYGTVDMGCYEHIFPGMIFSGH